MAELEKNNLNIKKIIIFGILKNTIRFIYEQIINK